MAKEVAVQGYILVSNEEGRRWLYVPEAHIQVYATKGGQGRWIVCAFRTDGYYGRAREEAIPTIEHLKQAYRQTTELEVPDHVVAFAVESERSRQASVEGIEQILVETVRNKNPAIGFKELMAQLEQEKSDIDLGQAAEDRIGKQIDELINDAGGLS